LFQCFTCVLVQVVDHCFFSVIHNVVFLFLFSIVFQIIPGYSITCASGFADKGG
jgi:hypothetical protein